MLFLVRKIERITYRDWVTQRRHWFVLFFDDMQCCFTLKLPSPTLVTRTTPATLLRRYLGAAQEMIRETAKHGLDE